MSTFAAQVRRIEISPHPNADALEIAQISGYTSVVGKGQFRSGDLAAYIPEGALLLPDLIASLGLTGKLAGPEKNRVHPVSLRSILSQGVCVPMRAGWVEGQDVTEELRLVKYVPAIPAELDGAVYVLEPEEVVKFDVEDIKGFPDIFAEGEEVILTEKVHGVFMMAAAFPSRMMHVVEGGHPSGRFAVSSKGLMHDRLGFQFNDQNATNRYVRAVHTHGLAEPMLALADRLDEPVFVLGELAGTGVQDLGYGQPGGEPTFRVFAIAHGRDGFVNDADLAAAVAELGLTRVPVLYRGPFNAAVLAEHTNGKETISGRALHVREGVVVTPVVERRDPRIGRVMLRSISPAYLLRKGGTEFN